MDEDNLQLVRQLCTRAGMLMEDMHARAVLIGSLSVQDLAEITREIGRTADDILALARAADALLRHQVDEDMPR
jgi:hypothetical protein